MEHDYRHIHEQALSAIELLLSRASFREGDICVIGCSTSEVAGKLIGTSSNASAAKAIMDAVLPKIRESGLFLAVQCCEHLNRAIVVEAECAKRHGLTEVCVLPRPHAGGAFAVEAVSAFNDYVMVENISGLAVCGMDIGDTFIGMHLRPVAVPVRTTERRIGEAHLSMATTRPKYIGGERAEYPKPL